jgi:hypothetical protein
MKHKFLTSLRILALIIATLHPLFGQAQAQINESDTRGTPLVSYSGYKVPASREHMRFSPGDSAQADEETHHLSQQLGLSLAGVASTPVPTVEAPASLQLELDSASDSVPGASSQASVASATIDNGDTITALIDTEIIQGYPAANCGSGLLMRAGYDTHLDPDGEIVRSLIQFNLARIAPQATVYSATLRLYLFSSYDYPGHSVAIRPYRISSPWAVDTVTWNSRPSYAESYPATWITHGAWGWHSFDVTDLVRSWVTGTYPNYGLMLRGPEASAGWRAFTTSETIYPPHLVIEYEQSPDYTLTIVPDSQAVSTGRSSSSILYLTATDGFSDSVALAVAGLPAHTSYAWSANPATPTTSIVLTITTTPDTPAGQHIFTVTGTAGSVVHSVQATLQVSAPDFDLSLAPSLRSVAVGESAQYTAYLTATDGFSDSVALAVGGLPAHTSYTWSANPVTPTTSTILTITTTPDTPTGLHTFTVTGTAGSLVHSVQATLQVSAPDFELSLAPSLRSVLLGKSAHYTVYLTATGGFMDSVTLAVGGLPANTSYAWRANPVTPTTSTILTITTTPDTPTGEHAFTVTGTSGPIVHSAQAVLDVSTSIYLPIVSRNHSTTNIATHHRPTDNSGIVQANASAATSAVSRIALVIGVADYQHMDPASFTRAGAPGNDLGYTGHDAWKFGATLRTRGGFSASAATFQSQASDCNCYTLFLDSQATKAAIHAAIVNWMDPLEDENTVVVIFFSGHGMYGPDDDGDEADSYDEFIVPYEMDWDPIEYRWRYEMAIRDDELKNWLSVLESQHIVVLTDSCFSGGMIETSVGGTRGLVWQPASHGEVTAAQWRDGFTRDVQGPGRVVLTASAEDQPSWEFGALQDGAFTYYLIEALSSASADTNHNGWVSAEEAFTYLANRVDSYVYGHTGSVSGGPYHQNPQISDGVSGEVDLAQLGETIQACPSWD